MAIKRAARPAQAFTQLRNDVLRDDRLSYRARGILAAILSHTEDWRTSAESLARTGTEGRDAIRTALTELEDAGYLVREKRQDDRGRWSTQAVVYDAPQPTQGSLLEFPQPVDKSVENPPTTDYQSSVLQSSENQASIEHHLEHSVPTERAAATAPPTSAPDVKAQAKAVATAVYEHSGKMVPFMGMVQVATRALKTGAPQEAVQAAMVGLWDAGRPITTQTLGQALRTTKGTVRDANTQHWANGGQFMPPQAR